VPTLVVHARDDPFLSPEAIPTAAEVGPAVTLDIHDRGGHVGFVAGRWQPDFWLERRIPAFLGTWLVRAEPLPPRGRQ
jgi:hypothetical protein